MQDSVWQRTLTLCTGWPSNFAWLSNLGRHVCSLQAKAAKESHAERTAVARPLLALCFGLVCNSLAAEELPCADLGQPFRRAETKLTKGQSKKQMPSFIGVNKKKREPIVGAAGPYLVCERRWAGLTTQEVGCATPQDLSS